MRRTTTEQEEDGKSSALTAETKFNKKKATTLNTRTVAPSPPTSTTESTTTTAASLPPMYWHIQIKSSNHWGLLPQLTQFLQQQEGLQILDHRTCHDHVHPSIVYNEIYCRDAVGMTNNAKGRDAVLPQRSMALHESLQRHFQGDPNGGAAVAPEIRIQEWHPAQALAQRQRQQQQQQQQLQNGKRRKAKSTPVGSGSRLFGNPYHHSSYHNWNEDGDSLRRATIIVDGKSYHVRIAESSLQALQQRPPHKYCRRAFTPAAPFVPQITIFPEELPAEHLQGFIRQDDS